jgi:TolB-like protein/tRNA A-37 threonylcarbamoyl transferase component Bud32
MGLSTPQIALMSRLLDEALPLDAAGRREWLERLLPEHQDIAPALRRALLPKESEAATFNALDTLPSFRSADEASGRYASGLKDGARVGPYELIRRLGAGGMAEVWLARRADGAFKREVALKLPTLTYLRGDLEGRFAQERDILASLEHPQIARFYDAGIDPNGLPYFAMEYVRGERITAWCDAQRLDVPERLKLVLQVLDALQYAHAHLVIHRDIKPSNILVNEAGQVRLLDFGVAKLLAEEDESRFTVVFGRALTPEYASPEMARGDFVQPSSDVYSTGVLLYELLTGGLPYGIDARGSAAGLEQAIIAAEVTKPSKHLTPDAGICRSASQDRLVRQLRGDLDAIVLKALAKTTSERYGTAAALAGDLQRYLNGQPVEARPVNFSYRILKLLQRRPFEWTAAVAGILAAVMLVFAVTRPPLIAPVGTASAPFTVRVEPGRSQQDKSIAVLPFVDMSEQKNQEYFSDGLSDELINHLSHSAGLKVIARTSSFQFKGRNEDVRSIAGKLGVAHLLEGSVRKVGKAVRVTTQLIQASDGVQLWSQTYDADMGDIFKVQDEIADNVAKALNTTLSIAGAPLGRQADVEAYNLVLEGNYYKARRTKANVEKAVQLYRKAIDTRPNYALAWARLASAYLTLEQFNGTASAENNARIVDALERAIRLDPTLVWAYYTRAGFEIAIQWDWAAANADHERMRALDPGNSLLPSALGDMAMVSGHIAEALGYYERAIELNPLDGYSLESISEALCASDRLPECLQYRLKLQQLHPDFDGVNSLVGMAHLYLGQLAEARDAMSKEPEEDRRLAGLAAVYAAMGKRTESDAALKTLEHGFAADDAFEIAQIHAFRGEADSAFDWLQRSYQRHDSKILSIKTEPALRNLRSDRRFRALLVELKLPE